MTRVLAMPTDEEGMAALETFVRGMTRTPEPRPETAQETAVRAIRETETRVSIVLPPSIQRHEAQGRAHGTAETRRLMRCAAVRSGIARGRRRPAIGF